MMKSDVCIYYVDVKNFDSKTLYGIYKDQIEPERIQRIDSCKNEKEKHKLILTGVLLANVLKLQGIYDAKIEYKKQGKPYIKGRTDFFISISHSGDFILVATSDTEIGMDIQKAVDANEKLLARITTSEERDTLLKANENKLSRIWAVKESYVKLTGDGLKKDFSEVNFSIGGNSGLLFDKGVQTAFYKTFAEFNEYTLAVSSYKDFEVNFVRELTVL